MALLAQVLLQAEQGVPELQLKRDALAVADRLRAAAVPVALEENEEERSFSQAIYMLLKRRQIELTDSGRLCLIEENRPLLSYYRNAIPVKFR